MIVRGGGTGTSALAARSTRNKHFFVTSAAPFSDLCRLEHIEYSMNIGPVWKYWWEAPGWINGLRYYW